MNVETHIKHIEALIRSSSIAGYLVGITKSIDSRRAAYTREGFPLFYILDCGLKLTDAIQAEREIFQSATTDHRSILYKKYQDPKRLGPYRSSVGGTKDQSGLYCVYIAAWLKEQVAEA